MKTSQRFYSIFSLFTLLMWAALPTQAQIIIPTPQKITPKAGAIQIDKFASVVLVNDNPDESAITATEVVNEAFKDFWKIPTKFEMEPKKALVHFIRINQEQALKYLIPLDKLKEGYRLHIEKERVTIESYHPQGLFYGANTLAQIIAQSKNKKLACTEIVDWANFAYRGISDDISRGQIHTFQQYKKLIRELARYKQNTLMMYIEDAVELFNFSEITQNRPHLTQKEVKDLVGYAEKYYVDIIPIVETLGHQENILNIKAFHKLGEFSGAMSFCVTEPLVYVHLDKVLKEIAQIFKSPYLHIGGDESFDVGMGRSKELAKKMGLPALHLKHYKQVAEICRKYNKKPIIYSDMLLKYPEIFPKIDNDFTIVDWQYAISNNYPSTQKIQQTNLPYWVSPTVFNFNHLFPQNNNAIANIKLLAMAGKANGAKGLITSNWGDLGNESPKDLLTFLYAFNGACAWNIDAANAEEMQQVFFKLLFRFDSDLAKNCYTILANPALEVSWKEFWRHPLLPTKASSIDLLTKKSLIEKQLPILKKSIDSLRRQTKAHTEVIDAWEITTQMLGFYAQKIVIQERLKTYNQLSNQEKGKQIEELLKELDVIPTQIQTLQTAYETYWKKRYKPEGLEPIKWKFKRLIDAFQESKDILLGQQTSDVKIPSKWIYPATTETEVIFTRTLYLNDPLITATMQIIADCYAEVYVNEKLVDSVYTRNIFSAHLEPKLIKFIDFKSKLSEDENEPIIIKIKARNYNEGLRKLLPNMGINPSAGINVIIRLQELEIERYIYSDESWEYLTNEKDKNLKKVTVQPYRYDIVAPNFQQNRPSWIER